MWYCAFCNEENEQGAEHCKECGAHRPVDVSLAEARKIAPDIPVRIAGLRVWVFIPAVLFFALTALSYSQYQKAKRVVSGYRADCANIAPESSSGVCMGVPATYKFLESSGPNGAQILEIVPDRQTPFDLVATPGSLPRSGKGLAIFWKGMLTALATSSGQTETNLSPVHRVHDQQAPIFCWFLMGFGALMFPFTRGFALILEPDVDEDLKPKKRDLAP